MACGVNTTRIVQVLFVPVPVVKALVDAQVLVVAFENEDGEFPGVPNAAVTPPSSGMPELVLSTVTVWTSVPGTKTGTTPKFATDVGFTIGGL
jgi:hypothetical protein